MIAVAGKSGVVGYQIGPGVMTFGNYFLTLAATATVEDAAGLIAKIYAVVDKYGKYVTFNWDTPRTIKVTPPARYMDAFGEADVTRRGDVLIFLPSQGVTEEVGPGLEVLIDAVKWRVEEVKSFYTFTEVGLYKLRLVKLGNVRRTASTAETALDKRLIPKINTMVNKYGIDATLEVITSYPSYDTTTMSMTGGATSNESVKLIMAGEYESKYVDGDLIKVGDERAILAAHGLTYLGEDISNVTTLPGTTKAQEWEVVTVEPVYTGEKVGLYILQVRR